MATAAGQIAGDSGLSEGQVNRPQRAPYAPLVIVLVAFCAGLCLDRYWPQSAWIWWTMAVLLMGAWWGTCRQRRLFVSGLCLLLAVTSSAAAWHHTQQRLFGEDNLARFARFTPGPTCLRVRATETPERIPASEASPLRALPSYDRTRLVVEVEQLRDHDQWRAVSGRATLTVEGHLLGIQPGDQLQVFAQLSRPSPALNPGEFDFAEHVRRDRQTAQLFASFPDCVTLIGQSGSWGFGEWLAGVRGRGEQLLLEHAGEENASLASAVLLGQRSGVPRDTSEAFVQTGTVHLLAISGLHVGILAGALMLVLRLGWLPDRWVLLGVVVLTLGYALLAGARPSVVRAAILVTVFCLSIWLGRPALRFNNLAAAGLVVLVFQPLQLFAMGTQLSFLAVGTLICARPVFARWQQQDALTRLVEMTRPGPIRLIRWCGRWYFRVFLAGLAVWLVTLPLLMYQIHLVSPAGVLVTPLLYIPLALALISGLAVLTLGWIAPPLASLCGEICAASIATLDGAVAWVRDLPGSFAWVAGSQLWWMLVFYAAAISWALLPHFLPGKLQWRPRGRWCLAALGVWIAVGALWPVMSRPEDELRCTFLGVGHGCSVALELPDDRVLLYDAGRLASPRGAARSISSFLWSRGRTHIDAIVISHADVDHYNGVPELLERFSVGVVYVSPVMLEETRRPDAGRAVKELFRSIDEAGVPVRTLQAGQRLAGGEVQVDVLHPTAEGVLTLDRSQVDNANSLVLAIEYAGRRILLPGDLESPGSDDLMAEQPWDCDVLLAPHHGSPRSNPPGFAAWCRPEWTIVSGRRGLDLTAILAAFEPPGIPNGQVLHTAEQGAIAVRIGKSATDQARKPERGSLRVEAFRD